MRYRPTRATIARFDGGELHKLSDAVDGSLRREIMAGALPLGAEVALDQAAEGLAVSTMPLRASFTKLVADNIVGPMGVIGIRIPEMSHERFDDPVGPRQSPGGVAVELAAVHVTSEDLASIELLCEQMNEADRSSIEWADRDRQFKFAIYSKSGSSSLRDFITRAWLQIGPAMRGVDRSKADLDPGCREFVAALRAHVSAAARRLLELDIRASADAALLQPVHA